MQAGLLEEGGTGEKVGRGTADLTLCSPEELEHRAQEQAGYLHRKALENKQSH